MSVTIQSVHVLIPIPGERGVAVVPLDQLLRAAIGAGGEPLSLDDLMIDSTYSDVEAAAVIDLVRNLNATGDADAYWRAR